MDGLATTLGTCKDAAAGGKGDLLEQLQHAGESLEQTQKTLSDTGEALSRCEGELKDVQAQCAEANRRVWSLEERLKDKAAEVEQLEAATARVVHAGGNSVGQMGELSTAEVALKEAKTKLNKKSEALGAAEGEIGCLKGRCAQAERKIGSVAAQLKGSREDVQRLETA